MITLADDVVQLEASDLTWPFRPTGTGPEYLIPTRSTVDPFPCYPHQGDEVLRTLELVKASCPLDPSPIVYLFVHEPPTRTNGWAEPRHTYGGDHKHQPAPGIIVLAGKRIPPHPAVTRYLVAHEYGHHVDMQLCRLRGVDPSGLDEEYAKARGVEHLLGRPYGGGTWHETVGELIANDFRCLVARVEAEFWPHPTVEHPAHVPAVQAWWDEQLAETEAAAA